MDKDYSKREIDTYMDEIKDTLNRIENQTTKTNGSIARANEKIAILENWKATSVGLFSAGTIIAGLIVYIWTNQIGGLESSIKNNSNQIKTYMDASVYRQDKIINQNKEIINNQ